MTATHQSDQHNQANVNELEHLTFGLSTVPYHDYSQILS